MSDTRSGASGGSEEELLRRSLHELAESDGSPEEPLEPGGLVARGRRTLRRRRVAGVTASLALLGVVGASGVYGGVFDAEKGRNADIAAEKRDAERAVTILKGLLPEGKVTGEREQRHSRTFRPYLGGSLVFDDGKGAAAVSVVLDRNDSPGWAMASIAFCSVGADGVGSWGPNGTCTHKKLADGSDLTLTQEHEEPYREQDTKVWSARLIKPDGSMLTVTERNAPAEKGAEQTRDNPPLTQQQLSDVVTAKEWQAILDSLPLRGGGEEDGKDRTRRQASKSGTPSNSWWCRVSR